MASFFSKYPTFLYKTVKATDILSRVALRQDYSNKAELYYEYSLKEGDTPEIVAWKYYGDAEKHWLVLFANEIIDPVFDFPLSDAQFNIYVEEKYKSFGHLINVWVDNLGWIERYINGLEYAQITLNPSPFTYKITTTTKIIDIAHLNQFDSIDYELGKEYTEIDYVGENTGGVQWNINSNLVLPNGTHIFPQSTLDVSLLTYEPQITNITVDGVTTQISRKKEDVYIYDWEKELNERKRTIKLIKKEYASQFEQELRSLLSTRYV